MPTRSLTLVVSAWLSLGLSAVCTVVPVPAAPSGQPTEEDPTEEGLIGFASDRWVLRDAEVIDHLGRMCLAGFAYLEGVEFETGVIEVDVLVDGRPSYPGIVFRMQSEENYESVYLRPHRAGLYPDAIQYTPVINAVGGWQLYSGEGFTAGVSIPTGEWMTLRLEVGKSQARVYLGDSPEPALVIDELQHGVSRGAIGLSGRRDGTAYFSRFRYRTDDDLAFDPVPEADVPPGIITGWELSPSFKISRLDMERPPGEQELGRIEWEAVEPEPSGLVDVGRYRPRQGGEPDCVLARTTLRAGREETLKLLIGYSDAVSVFLNDEIRFTGTSAYRQRDPSFLGILGLFDVLYLPLEEGENELLLAVAETFGGWGFMCRDADAVFQHNTLEKVLETEADFITPESVVYDSERDVLYVSNFDSYNRADPAERQFISRVSLDGTVRDLRWVTGLTKPTGMVLLEDTLVVVDRRGLTMIDAVTGDVLERLPVRGGGFLNDVAADEAGRLYVSDPAGNTIYRLSGGELEPWIKGGEIEAPNGLCVHGGSLIVGNNGDHRLKAVDLEDGSVRTIARLVPGIIDGVALHEDGTLLVSHWEGRLYRITTTGEVEKILDTTGPGVNLADFAYVADDRLLVIPTFMEDNLIGYRLRD